MDTPLGFRLSPQQARLWNDLSKHPLPMAVALVQIEGPLRPDKLQQALGVIVSRHEILRTVFRRAAGTEFPLQVVLGDAEPAFETIGVEGWVPATQELEAILDREGRRDLNLEAGPLFHVSLVKQGEDRWALIMSLPSLLVDLRSLEMLVEKLGSAYSNQQESADDRLLPYAQVAQWQNELLQAEDSDARQGRGHWSRLAASGLPTLVLPQQKNSGREFRPDRIPVVCEPFLVKRLISIGTPANVLLAAWHTFLWRITGTSEFSTSVWFDGREYEGLKSVLGPMSKTLPLPAHCDGNSRFEDVLKETCHAAEQAAEWQAYLNPDTAASSSPVAFEYQELTGGEQVYGGVKFKLERRQACIEQFVLKLVAQRWGEELRLELHYDSSRLERETVERWSRQFQTLLAAATERPETLISRLPLLSVEERQRMVVEWNRTEADYPRSSCVQELFQEQVERTPERTAVQCAERKLSYRELNDQANRLAHYLRELGVRPDQRVGLCLDRGVEMLVGVLAILKAGGAYVPLSGEYPAGRLAQQLKGAVALLTEEKLRGQIPEFSGPVLSLDGDQRRWADRPASNPAVETTPENLVYVIYTSGSTGVPKGVAVRHRNLVNYAHCMGQRLQLEKCESGLRFATVSTLSADLGNTCIYPALLSGGCVHVVPYEVSTSSHGLGCYMKQYEIDVLKIVPSHLTALLEAGAEKQVLPRKYMVLGGETLTAALLEKIEQLGGLCEVINHYGPTETTVGSLILPLREYNWRKSGAGSIPIGRPLANTRVYVLDGEQEPVPVGVAGELYIGGDGVAAGYLGQLERTAERFVADRFTGEREARLYRTGDLARYLADGTVEFMGRADEQVKIRGFRVELGEIEAALGRHAAVKQAAVLAREDDSGERRLVAYVVVREAALGVEQIREYLKTQLPDYMVPGAIVSLVRLPLTANGKIDRQALPEPEQAPEQDRGYVAPRTPSEQIVAKIWAEVLNLERVSVNDDFFRIGGHSLKATQVISRVRKQLRKDLPIHVMFEHPTVAEIAAAMDAMPESSESGENAQDTEIVAVARNAYRVA
jgi:amino acid adenylation domain-containing protein